MRCILQVRRVVGLFLVALSGGVAAAADPPSPARGQKLLDDYFRHQVQGIADRCLAEVKTKEDWERLRPEYRRQYLDMMGLWPLPPRNDLKATVTGKVETDTFTVEKLHYQSLPGLYVTANLYVPKGLQAPAPAVVYVCGHANTVVDKVSYGSKVNYQHHPTWLAEHGYVCLIVDTLQYHEIEGIHHGTHPRFKYHYWWWHTRGYTPAGIECWNAVRALDYLETRKEVDPKRLGVTGRSGGGATSWWLAAADDRVQCIIPVAGIADLHAHVVEGVTPRYRRGVIEGHCDCMYMNNTYRWDFALVAALCAPRPLLLGNSDVDDIFPVPGYRRLADKVRKIYDLYGAGDKFALLETRGPHQDTPELRLGAFRWLNRWLKNDDTMPTEQARPKFTPQQLKVFDRLPADALNATIHEHLIPAAKTDLPASAAEARRWWPVQSKQWRRELSEKVFAGWPQRAPPLDVRPAADVKYQGVRLRAYDYTSETAVPLRLWVATAEGVEKPAEVVVTPVHEAEWVAWTRTLGPAFRAALQVEGELPGNDQALKELHDALARTQQARVTVAPRGIGPTRWAEEGSPAETHVRRRFALIGQTLDGQRVWDTRRAVAVVRDLPGLRDVPMTLQGKGNTAGIALYAGLFEPEVLRLDLADLPASHRTGPTFLNVRRILDAPQALALTHPREVRLTVKNPGEKENWEWPLRLQTLLGQGGLKIHPVGD